MFRQLLTQSRKVSAVPKSSFVAETVTATTSGTTHDYTGIKAGVVRIDCLFFGQSTNGTSNTIIQLGDSGGFETSNYLGSVGDATASDNHTNGFRLNRGNVAANVGHGILSLVLADPATNTWVASGTMGLSNSAFAWYGGGSKALSGTLTQVRLTTVNGTDAFDAGSFNILKYS